MLERAGREPSLNPPSSGCRLSTRSKVCQQSPRKTCGRTDRRTPDCPPARHAHRPSCHPHTRPDNPPETTSRSPTLPIHKRPQHNGLDQAVFGVAGGAGTSSGRDVKVLTCAVQCAPQHMAFACFDQRWLAIDKRDSERGFDPIWSGLGQTQRREASGQILNPRSGLFRPIWGG